MEAGGGEVLGSQAGASPFLRVRAGFCLFGEYRRASLSWGRQECEARAGWDSPLIPSSPLHPITSFSSFSLSSIIMCIQDCLHDPGKGLSQEQSFTLNWAPRSKSKCLVLPGPGSTVHVCGLFGILSIVQSCVFVQSQCPRCMHCQFLKCKAWEWGDAPWGLWPDFWLGLWSFWMEPCFPHDHKPMLDQQSPREFGLQQYDLRGCRPSRRL